MLSLFSDSIPFLFNQLRLTILSLVCACDRCSLLLRTCGDGGGDGGGSGGDGRRCRGKSYLY